MTQLFSAVQPGAGFEDRLIARLRARGPRLRINPFVQRAAVAAAAAIVLGGVGWIASEQIERGGLDITRIADSSSTRVKVASNLRRTAQSISLYSNDSKPASPQQRDLWFKERGAGDRDKNAANVWYGDGLVYFDSNLFDVSGQNLERFSQVTESEARFDRSYVAKGVAVDSKSPHSESQALGEVSRRRSETLPGSAASPAQQESEKSSASHERTAGHPETHNGRVEPPGSGVLRGGRQSTDTSGYLYFRPIQLNAQTESLSRERSSVTFDYATKQSGNPVSGIQPIVLGQSVSILEGTVEQQSAPESSDYSLSGNVTSNRYAQAGDPAANAGQPANTAPATQLATGSTPATTGGQVIGRKVIRNGDVEFEVENFDTATVTVTKIVAEEGGLVATTNSEKLPNGKVKGVMVLRVPPDRLDTLVMKLRALGDLKRQNLTAQDVTKQYTDTASALRAARAMEERLLAIIKNSQGQIKDLLAAEKELATWRGKIEQMEGELRYYDNLVAMSTLNVSMFERDIKTAAIAKETENVDMGVETDDVEKARADAMKIIEEARGRIVESELKKLDAGQLAAKIVAEISPDTAGPALDRLKQLGKVARLESQRTQKAADGQKPQPGTKLERGETRLVLSLYNLANVAPRINSNITLAATDVEQAYQAIIAQTLSAGGRIVTSNLNRLTDQQTNGVIQLEVPRDAGEAALAQIRQAGEIKRLTVSENQDTANVTTAKQGFSLSIVSMDAMQPKEQHHRELAAADVDQAMASLLEALRKADARLLESRNEDVDHGQRRGALQFEVTRAQLEAVEQALDGIGETIDRRVATSADGENVTDSKVRFALKVVTAQSLPPRQTDALAIEVNDVDAAAQKLIANAKASGGRVLDSNFSKDERGQTARVVVEVPHASDSQFLAQARQLGEVRGSQQATNPQAPAGELARSRVEVTFASRDLLVQPDQGFMASLRKGLSRSFAGLMWSLQLIIIGLCLVGPWALLIWGVARWVKRSRRKERVAV